MVRGRWLVAAGMTTALAAGCGGKAVSRSDSGAGAQGGVGARGGSEHGAGGSTTTGGTQSKSGAGGAANGGQVGTGSGGQSQGGVGVAGTAAAGAAGEPSTDSCTSDADCRVIGCCGSCVAIRATEPDSCLLVDCHGPGCEAFSSAPVEPRCVAGRCVTSISCDERLMPDDVVLPPCPDGMAHAIEPAGTAECMPIGECSSVTSCAVCESAGLLCVTHEPGGVTPLGPTFHCVDLPAECGGQPSCDCMKTCVAPNEACGDNGLSCVEFCPNC